jgi:hypothetical protein
MIGCLNAPMKPSALRIERLLAKVEAEHNARIRLCRYVVYEDEYDEAIAKGTLPPAGPAARGADDEPLASQPHEKEWQIVRNRGRAPLGRGYHAAFSSNTTTA